jgi:molybdopterin converting factor small subunit
MKVRLRFFASLRERLRMAEREIDLPEGATVRRIWDDLCAEHPGLDRLGASVSFAVNRGCVHPPGQRRMSRRCSRSSPMPSTWRP